MENITIYLEMIVKILVMVVGVILIPLIKSKTSETQRKKIVAWVNVAVQAAEEAERAGLIDKSQKYDYALKQLEKHGVTFDADTMQGLIDSAVWELFNQFKDESKKEG